MRILFLTEQFPYPLHDGGNLRTFHMLRALAREHEVWLLSHAPRAGGAVPACLQQVLRQTTIVEPPADWRRLLGNATRNRRWRWPLFLLKNWSEPLLKQADRLLGAQPFDAVHFNHLDTAGFVLEREWPHWKVFDTHNCLTSMAAQVRGNGVSRIARAVLSREVQCLREVEMTVCGRMTRTLVCSDQDGQAFRGFCKAGDFTVVPNGVDTDYFEPGCEMQEEDGVLVFTGAMNYYPNENAAIFFCREVMPLLGDCKPSPRLFLVGKTPTRRVRALHNGTSVIVTGQVADVRPYVVRAQAMVVPLHHGSGTRLKILEALSMGKVVISTSRGAEGIPATPGKELLIADDPVSFAEQIRRVLCSKDLRRRLGRSARALASEQFAWRRVTGAALDAYRSIDKGQISP